MGARKNLKYHIVLVSKYRNKCFSGLEQAVLDAFSIAESKSSFELERVAVEDGNHVHLVIRTTGSHALNRTIARVKSIVAHELWETHELELKKHYWSGRQKLWSGGYYAATIGDVSSEQVEKYLKKQGHWK